MKSISLMKKSGDKEKMIIMRKLDNVRLQIMLKK